MHPVRICALTLIALVLLAPLPAARAQEDVPAERPSPAAHKEALRLNEQAVARYEAGEHEQALVLLRRALVLDPTEPTLRANAAVVLMALGDAHFAARRFEAAVRDYHEAGRFDPAAAGPALREASALLEGGRARDAAAVLERAAAEHPKEVDAHRLLGEARYRLGENAAAIAAWEAALALAPEDEALTKALERARREEAVEAGLAVDLGAPHFTIKVDGELEAALGRQVGSELEAAYERVGALLGRYPRAEVAVVIYPGRAFQALTGAHGWVAALYDGKIRIPAKGLAEASPGELRRVLSHEYAHALVRAVGGPKVPPWLHEGFAQLAEGRSDADARRELTRASAPAAEALQRSFLAEADRDEAARRYAAACSLVHHLLRQGGLPTLADLLDRLGRGEPPSDALRAVYGLELPALVERWRATLPPG